MKLIKAAAVLVALVVLALEVAIFVFSGGPGLLMVLPPLLLLWPAAHALQRRLTRITVSGDRLRYEAGFLTKSTRTIQLPKVQDVRVDQGLVQRIWNVGNLSIETAGETSRLTIDNVDSPQELADELLNRAQHTAPPVA
jgi:membrane protein YdbS with pleckstrin-like domain